MPLKKYPSVNAIHINSTFKYRELWVSLFLVIIIATLFWTQSRVPALSEKAQLGDRINISAIAFDSIVPVVESQPLYERTFKSAVNWAYTNWKGMTFGFLLASAFITLLQLLPDKLQVKNKYLNSLTGLIMGSPLGVCVNCATPIAQGLIHAGSRLETSLALLLSSPTLNPIVLMMAFSLLPLHVALIKIILSIIFILFIIPILVKHFTPENINLQKAIKTDNKSQPFKNKNDEHIASRDWNQAIMFIEKSFFKNLYYIIRMTLPFMLAAGLLGALLVETMPTGSLANFQLQLFTIIAFAVVGSFLPVPIAFDILIINILISSGLNTGLASVLLFSLGIFSIYPALILGRSISFRFSFIFFLAIATFASLSGVITEQVDLKINQYIKDTIEIEFSDSTSRHAGKQTYNKILQSCDSFDNETIKKHCLYKLLSGNTSIKRGINICPENSDVEKNSIASNICSQQYALSTTQQAAITKDDILLCESLSTITFINQCKINYIRSKALSYSSLNACLKLSNPSYKNHCRYMIIADRMHLKSPEACDLELSDNMHRQCMDNLAAHITSELGEIEKCNQLKNLNAQKICRETVTSLQISNLQNYDICQQLNNSAEAAACEEKVITQKSLIEQNPLLCQSMPSQPKFNNCYINAAIHKKQRDTHNIDLLNFNTNTNITASNSNGFVKNSSNPAPEFKWTDFYNSNDISIEYTQHQSRNIKSGTIFNKTPASLLGINSIWEFNLTDFMEPFVYGKGIASGDFNNDNWPDLAFASNNGLHLYQNRGDGTFSQLAHINIADQQLNAFVVSFVDINNDGWQDLFLSAYGGFNLFFINNQGTFSPDNTIKLKKEDTNISLAAGFSDWNKDGLLDIVIGNWSYGAEGAFIPEKSQNKWYINNNPGFISKSPDEPLGETLSILLSDLNNDSHPDLLIGNDRKYPDLFYYGSNNGNFNPVTRDMNIISETSFNTMSYESADFNNDLLLDIFSSDMSVKAAASKNYCHPISKQKDKQRCNWLLVASQAVDALDINWCAPLQGKQRENCYSAIAIKLAKQDKDKTLCAKLPNRLEAKFTFCNNLSRKFTDIKSHNSEAQLQQTESNKLLINSSNNKFTDATHSMGVENSYWSWSARAADLDNDGWQDLYIGNGLGFGQHNKNIHSNVFYHNINGTHFINREKEFGLDDYINTPSYTYIDLDMDGDLDIISTGVMSEPRAFINQGTTANSISFSLRDNLANKFCIGCKIIIDYNNNSQQQIREIKLSGGFMSFDSPVAYFGLANNAKINSIKVIWSTGESWNLNQSFSVNRHYKITRLAKNTLITNTN